MIAPFSDPSYERNQARVPGGRPGCVLCGRDVKEPVRFMVEIVDGGRFVQADDNVEALRADWASYIGWFPVGPECVKKLRANGVQNIHDSREETEPDHA
jgi:hypothetical protein